MHQGDQAGHVPKHLSCGEAEGAGLIQPEDEMDVGVPHSSPSTHVKHWEDRARIFIVGGGGGGGGEECVFVAG